jgi:hypothetical protein
MTIIRKHIMATQYYDDAEVPSSAPLLKMAMKRNWVGKDSNISRPSLINAVDGLSPFLVLDMTEDQVAQINEEDDALSRASYVTLQNIKNLKKHITPEIPKSADNFMLLLKRFTNLVYALFGKESPLF